MKFLLGGMLASFLVLTGVQSASAACTDPAAVAAARAVVAAECPCDSFDNHGQYVRCAKDVAKTLKDMGALPKNCQGEVVKCAAKSTCGKPGFVTCCRTNRNGDTKCSTKKDASKCKAPKGGSACVGTFSSCCDACTTGGCVGGPTPTPTAEPTPTQTPEPTPTPEPTAEPTPTPTPPYGSASKAFLRGMMSLLQ